jgi:hypothetical protein
MSVERAKEILRLAGAREASLVAIPAEVVLGVRNGERDWELLAWTGPGGTVPAGVRGETTELDGGTLLVGQRDHENAVALRALVPWLRPRLLGDATSFGFGDRLGIAGPGHVAALRANPGLAPVLAQQSARELGRTGRTLADVVDAATFGVLASGWRDGYAADADHLQTTAEVDGGIAAAVTMFTADPKAIVPDLAADAPRAAIDAAYGRVPWAALEDSRAAFEARYPDPLDLGDGTLSLPRGAVRAAAARFGAAVVHVVEMYRHVVAALGGAEFLFEVAVDEIGHPTTPVDHVYIATELRRLGVRPQSFAPRFVGEFEKGIDYLGDPAAFADDIGTHARIAAALGPYKISVHSGSDKFSIYELLAERTGGRFHLKTSGTSYLAALRTLAETEPELFRQVWAVASKVYTASRASYRVSAVAEGLAAPERLSGDQLVGLLDDPNSREILHVTYGAVLHSENAGGEPADRGGAANGLGDLGGAVREAVWRHREAYWAGLAEHMGRHLLPIAGGRQWR